MVDDERTARSKQRMGSHADHQLKEQLARSLFRFRKVTIQFPPELDLHMGEVFLMKRIARHAADSDRPILTKELQKKLHVTKPAISQMYRSLEKKGYIVRETDKADRRKVVVTLTSAGVEMLAQMERYFNQRLEEIITLFGEDDTRQLVDLFQRFADISEQLNEKGEEDRG
ncbi:hypothetical protein BEP19_13075 [Ammoniphilus oxalaticus]|uniref:HTH marR-type domain-containing protein n=1 Tax=Ammoniphilus oxalaticus TaxID=66863 RepID=A0A419SH73_9BACL|nr:MarR family transcriptional regulator [Ammoniphilus oxalaticus]RKD23144.1 hypothetical protein BEP19_13075 [Ammoniphilus oxalaticus]